MPQEALEVYAALTSGRLDFGQVRDDAGPFVAHLQFEDHDLAMRFQPGDVYMLTEIYNLARREVVDVLRGVLHWWLLDSNDRVLARVHGTIVDHAVVLEPSQVFQTVQILRPFSLPPLVFSALLWAGGGPSPSRLQTNNEAQQRRVAARRRFARQRQGSNGTHVISDDSE